MNQAIRIYKSESNCWKSWEKRKRFHSEKFWERTHFEIVDTFAEMFSRVEMPSADPIFSMRHEPVKILCGHGMSRTRDILNAKERLDTEHNRHVDLRTSCEF